MEELFYYISYTNGTTGSKIYHCVTRFSPAEFIIDSMQFDGGPYPIVYACEIDKVHADILLGEL